MEHSLELKLRLNDNKCKLHLNGSGCKDLKPGKNSCEIDQILCIGHNFGLCNGRELGCDIRQWFPVILPSMLINLFLVA
jgi:hypothetical protein